MAFCMCEEDDTEMMGDDAMKLTPGTRDWADLSQGALWFGSMSPDGAE